MVEHLEWHDPRFREHLRLLNGPGLAQELLRHIPAYVTGYHHLRQHLDTLTDLRVRYELAGGFAHHWGLSCSG
ncbi:transcriptional regulator domain-containing protein [Komagataeibacter europaeus]|uniref:transcriptional regulator domain-containing protein n=1 Tax=Komagataeibacter europaeus TaxID=33995 RepID=UPI000B585270|nr:DUF6499 domain-containing protein [Komagataeibacter europaeus]ARW16862.1 hypothetical protein S101446_01736 [Komagataeibacter europaeus]